LTVEEALAGALEYETRIRDIYKDAALGARQEEARALFGLLGKDEQSHIDYLNAALRRWRAESRIDAEGLGTSFPSPKKIQEAASRAAAPLRESASGRDLGGEVEALRQALAAEEETSAYYRTLADSLSQDARKVFERFVEIEDGHSSVVRAQLDMATRTGYWFDAREFDQED